MNDYTIKDLELAGVKWELTDNPNKSKEPVAEVQKNDGPVIIPATKPVESNIPDLTTVLTLDDFIQLIQQYEHPLKQFAKNTVLPTFGNISNDLMIITDMPSSDDEIQNKILTNGAGQLLDKMLNAIGFNRDTVSIVPLVFWRTPGGRTVTPTEVTHSKDFIEKAINLTKPRAILTLGTLPADLIANAKLPRDNGKTFETFGGIPTITIFHPSYLIVKPDAKRDVWEALQNLEKILKNP